MKKGLASIMVASIMMGMDNGFSMGNQNGNNVTPDKINVTPKEPIVPKGCKRYYFNVLGDCINWDNGQYEFKCIAINVKSARKKFNKWLKEKQ